MFLPPAFAILFLCRQPSICGMFLQGEAVPAQEASLLRKDVAEERVGFLNGHDYRNKCDPCSVGMITSHTSILKDR